MSRVLFICKQGSGYSNQHGYLKNFSGLFNSARLVSEMLNAEGVSSVVEMAVDNNDIDRLITAHNPAYCIIEAYWVVPSKFEVLTRLHPDVKWIIRIHSELPFWSTEGIAMQWTLEYLDYPNVILAPNSEHLYKDIQTVLSTKYSSEVVLARTVFLPNYYPVSLYRDEKTPDASSDFEVGCFGAIRPLKNQLIQAVAAVEYANLRGYTLKFHMNTARIEGHGEPVIKNIRALFATGPHSLVEHTWLPHSEFLELVATLDMGLQVSFTESFNIVAADFVSKGVPIVASQEIEWVAKPFIAETTSTTSIIKAMYRAEVLGKRGTFLNKYLLQEFVAKSKQDWLDYVTDVGVVFNG